MADTTAPVSTGIMSKIPAGTIGGVVGALALGTVGFFFGEKLKLGKMWGTVAGVAIGFGAGFSVDRFIIQKPK